MDLRHIAGEANQVADALSRPPVSPPLPFWRAFDLASSLPATEAGIDLASLQAAQLTDSDASQLTRLKGFRFILVMFKEVSLFCDVLTGTARPVVLAEFRRQVFNSVHTA